MEIRRLQEILDRIAPPASSKPLAASSPITELAPLLAERVLRLETALYQPEFTAWPPDERLAAEFHRRICHDLVPEWAGALADD